MVERAIAEAPTLSSELYLRGPAALHQQRDPGRLRAQFVDYLQSGSGSLAGGVITGLQTAAEVLTGVLLTLLLTIILLADGEGMWRWLVARLPESARPRLVRAGVPAWARLSGWMRGTVLIAIFHSAVVSITLVALGVPSGRAADRPGLPGQLHPAGRGDRGEARSPHWSRSPRRGRRRRSSS